MDISRDKYRCWINLLLHSDFNLTQEDIENAHTHDSEKHVYIRNYLEDYFVEKLPLLSRPEHTVDCRVHGAEHYTVDGEHRVGGPVSCPGDSFADCEQALLIHSTARFECKKDFPIGYCLKYRYVDLIRILEKLHAMSDEMLLRGKKFDEKNQLTVITGYMMNNFS